jgi:ATP-dependent DNA ligase
LMFPPRPSSIGRGAAEVLLASGHWVLQPKYDGVRRILRFGKGHLTIFNRHGKLCHDPMPLDLGIDDAAMSEQFILDAEWVAGTMFVHDIALATDFYDRHSTLTTVLSKWGPTTPLLLAPTEKLPLSPAPMDPAKWIDMYSRLPHSEGVVLKRVEAPYFWHGNDQQTTNDWRKLK